MKHLPLKILASIVMLMFVFPASAQVDEDAIVWRNSWFVNAQYGGSLAFGDDSYNIIDDFSDANGSSLCLTVGKFITPILGARVKLSRVHAYSRVNLESYNAFSLDYPDLFPRKGFYGYNILSAEADVMVNLLNIIRKNKGSRFDMYFIAGIGCNSIGGYDDHVELWTKEADRLPGGWYNVDNTQKSQLQASIGGQIDFRLSNNLSLNLEAIGTFTEDNMEGIMYEESYDVYITYTLGFTYRF